MDREAAVIRTEMNQTRADLDRKLAMLDERARQLDPRRLVDQRLNGYTFEYTVGGLLTLAGLWMAVKGYRAIRRRERVRAQARAYAHW